MTLNKFWSTAECFTSISSDSFELKTEKVFRICPKFLYVLWHLNCLNDRQLSTFSSRFHSLRVPKPSFGRRQGKCETLWSHQIPSTAGTCLRWWHPALPSFSPHSATNQTDAVVAMERCILDIRRWIFTDKLKLNRDKTELCWLVQNSNFLK